MGADKVSHSSWFAAQEYLQVEGVDAATVGSSAYHVDELVDQAAGVPVGQSGESEDPVHRGPRQVQVAHRASEFLAEDRGDLGKRQRMSPGQDVGLSIRVALEVGLGQNPRRGFSEVSHVDPARGAVSAGAGQETSLNGRRQLQQILGEGAGRQASPPQA